MEKEIATLLPSKLTRDDASYKSVEELNSVLNIANEKHIKNVAITGPFGSGKSSVLVTLMEDFKPRGREYLSISLATLQANDEAQEASKEESDTNKNNRKIISEKEKRKSDVDDNNKSLENLNRKIEYSILQQLIYREKAKTVPNSRLRRITHISKGKLWWYAISGVLTILALFIVFEPSFLRVDTLCKSFDFGYKWNTLIDAIGALWLLFAIFEFIQYVLKSYSNSKLNKLNLKDGEIEVVEDNSIFNKYLDEILYFFQVTKYNVVIIEDLDRFGSPNIFLKLRELNQLINESKIVGRHITFIYAIKDDIFKNEERTKFFDYITTVIPVINPSNSKAILRNKLVAEGFCENDIPDEDLSEMAFFIQDMRILTNIVNEYKQYREKLCDHNKQKLNYTKLLAMIVYKNYYPQDFAELHCRKGKVYACISKKRNFIDEALKELEKRKNALAEKEQIFDDNRHLNIVELRLLFFYKLREKYNERMLSIKINDTYHSFNEIAQNNAFFDILLKQSSINFQYQQHDYYGRLTLSSSTINIDYGVFDKDFHFFERYELLKLGDLYFKNEHRRIQQEQTIIRSLKLKDLIGKYNLGHSELYKSLELPAMQDVFLRRGYLDEDYYDYISYFYEGMVSLADRDLLLSIKRQISQPYDYHIDKIKNVVAELKEYMFESDAILNNELLDYLAYTPKQKENFEHIMLRLERDDSPMQFFAQYYIYGKQQQKVFHHFIEWDKIRAWKQSILWDNPNEREVLIEAYLKYSDTSDIYQEWLNDNYVFLTKHAEGLDLERCLKLAANSSFKELNDDNKDILDYVINNNRYRLTPHNLLVVTQYLIGGDKTTTIKNLNFTRIRASQNDHVINYIDSDINTVIKCLADENKDEHPKTILYILNHSDIDVVTKEEYLKDQHHQIDNFDNVKDASLYDIVIRDLLVVPTWKNVLFYFNCKQGLTDELVSYIEHFTESLSKEKCPVLENIDDLFVSIFTHRTLKIEKYKSLLFSFNNCVFGNCNDLRYMERDKLIVLIDNGKIPFNENTLTVMNESVVLDHFLQHHKDMFIAHLDWAYNITEKVAITLLKSSVFTIQQKKEITNIISTEVRSSEGLSDILAMVYTGNNTLDNDDAITIGIVKNCSNRAHKIKLAKLYILSHSDQEEDINEVLRALGNNFAEITDKSKRPIFNDEFGELDLLKLLEKIQYISSAKPESKGKKVSYRIYHKIKS